MLPQKWAAVKRAHLVDVPHRRGGNVGDEGGDDGEAGEGLAHLVGVNSPGIF